MRTQLESFLDDHRHALHDCLDDVTEQEARHRLLPSKTTLLGLVTHATFVELVWVNEAVTGRSRVEIGCPAGMLRELAEHCGHADILREHLRAHRRAGRP